MALSDSLPQINLGVQGGTQEVPTNITNVNNDFLSEESVTSSGTIDYDTTSISTSTISEWKLKGREIFSRPCVRDSAHKTTDPLIQRARTPRVLDGYLVASGIEPRPSGLESDALTTANNYFNNLYAL
ncbi:hypothetical protein TNCV_3696091 [Trichonephila clavipes]|nr:hypothetical protein TNCV_3696091 [Trichonephila clavipes]